MFYPHPGRLLVYSEQKTKQRREGKEKKYSFIIVKYLIIYIIQYSYYSKYSVTRGGGVENKNVLIISTRSGLPLVCSNILLIEAN